MEDGGAIRDRTVDLLDANQALSQLSYSPVRLPTVRVLLHVCYQAICVNTRETRKFPNAVLLQDKEVIQPLVPQRLPCYDFTPVMNHKVVTVLPKVKLATSFATHSHGVTGGVYKARERIHRDILIHDY